MHGSVPFLIVGLSSLASVALLPAVTLAAPTTFWAQFPLGPFAVGTPTTVPLGGGTTVQVTVTTGGTQGVNGAEFGTLGATETGLDYDDLNLLAIFNGGGSGSVQTTLSFTNIQPGAAHQRGLIMVGAVNGLSSPVTLASSVAGRVSTWTVVGTPFDLSPENAFSVAWNPGSGTVTTSALSGNDSRCIVIDLGNLATDGEVTITTQQHLNDGIVYSIGEEVAPALDAPGAPLASGLVLAVPRPNPVRDGLGVDFTLPGAMRARIGVFDLAGRQVAELANGEFSGGRNSVRWDLRGPDGSRSPAGLYFLRLDAAAGSKVQRIVLAP